MFSFFTFVLEAPLVVEPGRDGVQSDAVELRHESADDGRRRLDAGALLVQDRRPSWLAADFGWSGSTTHVDDVTQFDVGCSSAALRSSIIPRCCR